MRVAFLEHDLTLSPRAHWILQQATWLQQQRHAGCIIANPGAAIIEQARQRQLPVATCALEQKTNLITLYRLIRILRQQQISHLELSQVADTYYAVWLRLFTRVTVIRQVEQLPTLNAHPLKWHCWQHANHRLISYNSGLKTALTHSLSADKIDLVPLGIDAASVLRRPLTARLAFKALLQIPAQHKVIANISPISRDKGLHDFLTTCDKIAARYKDVSFILVGHAAQHRIRYQAQLHEHWDQLPHKYRIHFVPPRHPITDYLDLADLLLLTPVSLDTPTWLLVYAWLSHTLVLGTQVAGLEDLIPSAQMSLLHPVGDHSALANSALQLLTQPERLERLQQQSYQYALQQHNLPLMMQAKLNSYKTALGMPKKPIELNTQQHSSSVK